MTLRSWHLFVLLVHCCGRRASSHEIANGCKRLATAPLQGEAHLTKTSLPSIYDLKNFVCAWDVPAGVYWWSSPLKKGGVNPIYGGQSGNLTAEVGQGWWLTPPKYVNVTARSWTSHSFVATRVPAFNHTSCCCQIMSADLDQGKFWLTEYCRAVVKGLDKSARDTCAPYSSPCPEDNATAFKQHWPMPPYSESYSACLDPIGATLPMPEGLRPEYIGDQVNVVKNIWSIRCWLVPVLLSIIALLAVIVRCLPKQGLKEDTYEALDAGPSKLLGA